MVNKQVFNELKAELLSIDAINRVYLYLGQDEAQNEQGPSILGGDCLIDFGEATSTPVGNGYRYEMPLDLHLYVEDPDGDGMGISLLEMADEIDTKLFRLSTNNIEYISSVGHSPQETRQMLVKLKINYTLIYRKTYK